MSAFFCFSCAIGPGVSQRGGRVEAGCFRTSHLVYSFFLLFFFFLPSTTGTGVSQRGGTVLPHFVYSFFLFSSYPSSTTGTGVSQRGGSDRVPHTVYFRHGLWRLCPFAGIFFLFFVPFLFFFPLGHLQAQRGLYLQHKKQYRNGSKQD